MARTEKITHPEFGDLPRWDLTLIYPSPDAAEIEADKKLLTQKTGDFASRYEGKIGALDAEGLTDALLAYEEITVLMGKLDSYAGLLQSVSIGDEKSGQAIQGIEDHLTEQGSKLVFFTLEINAIDQARMDSMLQTSPRLAGYQRWFEVVRSYKPHELSPEVERFAAEHKAAAAEAMIKIFDEAHDEIRYRVGKKKLRQTEVLAIMSADKDGAKRREAFMALGKGLKPKQKLFTTIYNTIIKDGQTEDRWRHFANPQDSRHLSNEIEPEVVEALAKSVRSNYANLSHRYYALKAKWLGKSQLDPWDRSAPLPFSDTRVVPFAEAKQIVADAYRAFSPILADHFEDIFRQNLVDAPSVPGKESGAFAHPTTHGVPCYTLVNYLGRVDDVSTLAHEGGHTLHHIMYKDAQPPLLATPPLTLAETASVFGEMMTFKAMLTRETDPEKRQATIAGKVEDMLNTVVRQVAFYTFESRVHEERKTAPLTSEKIADIWQKTMAEAHGPAIREEKAYDSMWSYVSHFFHSPFYVYAYAFGDCLVNSLYGIYEAEKAAGRGDDFTRKYIDLLKAGGSKGHKELLAPFGLDAMRPDFWQKGLNVIAGFIDELEALDTQLAARPKGNGPVASLPKPVP